ncbi:kinase-like domain-containing protein [Rhizophagus irregularis DAOM 181602=DAOM 197198]|uniref:Kinase-like domain-containing protein n=1 Tax=Rhizophagus irregularis (strain DAOM 181602 / DAOM 197198 / MUCL 43194) TaxID=747089 RepID=A0A2P4PDP3_RHIID|nr:kinase-like domain-containing protein [Rhizophagus irregularis DAOM 181602=DAOM 197198]POG63508.1 kinase-like domain-containing protein [Rhizophagus irregularis DAOM 181602=DAOM 197198]|eukprot:XP_025170374.1 kinase-like domain-containing protein [Rhizophagus irregularis DAOM 181602=DAOM 197198]
MVLEYAENGNLNNWVNKNYKNFSWLRRLNILQNIIKGLKEIHRKGLVHRDFHTGNILLMTSNFGNDISFISDMGLCGEVGNMDETKTNIYGVMPYVAPEVLRGKPSTHSADIYSFAMIMYFVAARKQPFVDHAHDNVLALDICNGIRPEINEQEAPKCYIDLMNKCWDSKPQNRPNAIEIDKLILSFRDNFIAGKGFDLRPIIPKRNSGRKSKTEPKFSGQHY